MAASLIRIKADIWSDKHSAKIRFWTPVLMFLLLSVSGGLSVADPNNPTDSQSKSRERFVVHHGRVEADRWFKKEFSGDSPKPPFSFIYNGVSSFDLLPKWELSHRNEVIDPNRTVLTLEYVQPDGTLKVVCKATKYNDYPAIEWIMWFENRGSMATPIIENIQSLDMIINSDSSTGNFILHSSRGSYQSPNDFEPLVTALIPGTPSSTLTQGPISGRSSDGGNGVGNGRMPFFNIEQPGGKSGIILGIGWTGQWKAVFEARQGGDLHVSSGMELTHLRLNPGEKIRTPAILILFWEGEYIKSQNLFRKLVLDHYSPRPGGQPLKIPVASSGGITPGMGLTETSETNMKMLIERNHSNQYPVDTIWLDAGWYNMNGHEVGWDFAPGTWEPDPLRYPNGIKPVANYAHGYGYKFLLWFEPERVSQDSWLAENHPEWLLKEPNETLFRWLLNFGDPNALAWAKNKFSGMIKDIGVDIYRNDFNMNTTLAMWRTPDTVDRQGITEIRYIMGLYEFFDYLLQENPDLLIDNCAGGGRRIDFERRILI